MPNRKRKKVTVAARKTYTVMMNAFFELLAEKPFDRISVVDLCEKCGFTRVTFYNYFKDKYVFYDFCLEQILDAIGDRVSSCEKGSSEYIEKTIKYVKGFVDKNTDLTVGLVKARDAEGENAMEKAISKYFVKKYSDSNLNIPLELVAAYCAGTIKSFVSWYLVDGKDCSVEDTVNYGKKIFAANKLFV